MQMRRMIYRSLLLLLCAATVMPISAVSQESLERASVIDHRNTMHRLHAAVRIGDKETIVALLQAGFDVNKSEAMQLAVLMRRTDIIDLLIDQGADIDQPAMSGEPPLITALKHDRIETMKHLVRKGADTNCRDRSGKTALQHARRKGKPVVIEYLIANGAFHEPKKR